MLPLKKLPRTAISRNMSTPHHTPTICDVFRKNNRILFLRISIITLQVCSDAWCTSLPNKANTILPMNPMHRPIMSQHPVSCGSARGSAAAAAKHRERHSHWQGPPWLATRLRRRRPATAPPSPTPPSSAAAPARPQESELGTAPLACSNLYKFIYREFIFRCMVMNQRM